MFVEEFQVAVKEMGTAENDSSLIMFEEYMFLMDKLGYAY